MDRRQFIKNTSLTAAAAVYGSGLNAQNDIKVKILNPRNRVPLNFIIDDSTALVNMAHYGIPQFKQTWPDRYNQDWQSLPREIPDSFVMEFIEWCESMGVKGKYSMVPYPACTGWLHRFIPGWSQESLRKSLKLVRENVTPNWDIHPEMISHTRVVDIKTGLPYPHSNPDFMENWNWSQDKSADELAAYMVYAFKVLKEVGFKCDGLTTPGGFGSRNMKNLAIGTVEAVNEVYHHDIAHFFRDVITDPEKSVAPQILHSTDLDKDNPKCSVHIIGCTDDWFGGWDGLTPGDADKFISGRLTTGRMMDVIDRGEPAIMVCHWPGMYFNGEKIGFNIFKTVVRRLLKKYDNLIWMKLTDIARYWAVKEFVKIEVNKKSFQLSTPFMTRDFSLRIPGKMKKPVLKTDKTEIILREVYNSLSLTRNTWTRDGEETYLCFDLPKGQSTLTD